MTAETPVSDGARARRAGWRDWLQVFAIAALLLAFSEAIWLWQSWPVRELLQPTSITPAARPAPAR